MSHSIRIDSKSALVGVAAALVCVVAFGQVSVSRATTPTAAIAPGHGIGNPHPRDMVRFTTHSSFTGSQIPIPVGGEHTVFTVPVDKWLVLSPNVGICPLTENSGQGVNVSLYEDLNGNYTFAASGSGGGGAQSFVGPSGWVLGWVFKPGSRVVVKNDSPDFQVMVQYNFFGYLTDL